MAYPDYPQHATGLNRDVTLRPAIPEDSALVYHVKKTALRQYVEETWGWDENWQQAFHETHFNPLGMQIIQIDSRPAGYIVVREFVGHLLLESLHFLPEYQRRGIGTDLIQDVLRYGRESGRIVRLKVLRVNPSRRLYKRLGFVDVAETETHFIMECR